MRVGTNPAKYSKQLNRPARLTIATIVYIPFQAGYFEESLDVLKLCLASLRANTTGLYDLMVFDNGSCAEVVHYLESQRAEGAIQFLVLSGKNLGKSEAWNIIFGAAPGEYIAYTDSDVYFYPGWLDEEMKVMTAFENVGMVSGLPAANNFGRYVHSTLQRAEADSRIIIERGQFIPDEWITEWGESLGQAPEAFRAYCQGLEQVRLTRNGVRAYAVASHFQFLAPKSALQRLLPFRVSKPVGAESVLDKAMDEAGYMRLSVAEPKIYHLGNTLTVQWRAEADRLSTGLTLSRSTQSTGLIRRVARVSLVRTLLMRLYHHTSRWANYL